MHHLSILAVRRPVAITVIVLIILLFGAISLQRIGIDLLPNLNFPVAVVVTAYPNAPAEMVEQEVTLPIEGAVASVSGVRRIDSFSLENASALIMQFEWNTTMIEAVEEIRSKLAQASFNLPEGVQEPIVSRIDPNEFPLMLIGVTSNQPTLELSDTLREIRPNIEQISGVAAVGLLGARQGEIEVLYDQTALHDLNLDPSLLQQLIGMQNTIVPGGYVNQGSIRYTTRTGNRISTVDELGDLVIGYKEGSGLLSLGGLVPSLVHLSDIADITLQETEREGITRFNNSDTVLLRIMRQSGANTVQVANRVKQELSAIQENYQDLEFTPILDQSRFIEQSISSLAVNGLIGAALAILVLFLFLRHIPSLLVIGLAIPISVIASFIMVFFGNLTINIMTLGGLALGAGMLVDSSIVVLENIYRHRLEGRDPNLAAETGSKEIASAIIASTTTTLAVFLPVIFMQSIAGEVFKELGITVSFSLLASLLVALTIVPMLSARIFSLENTGLAKGYGPLFSRFQTGYIRLLQLVLQRKAWVCLVILISLVGSGMLFPHLKTEFLPELDEGFLSAQVLLEAGVPLEETKSILVDLERRILELPDVRGVAVQAGEQGDNDIFGMVYGANLHSAELQVLLTPRSERERSSREISQMIRSIAKEIGVVRITMVETSLFGSSSGLLAPSLLLEVRGPDVAILEQIAHQISGELADNPGFSSIQITELDSVNDLLLQVDPARGIMGGLTAGQVGLAVRQGTSGIKATDLYLDGKMLPVMLKPNHHVNTLDGLLKSSVTSPISINGMESTPVVLESIVETQVQPAPPAIQRMNRMRVINVTAQLGELQLSEAASQARRILTDMELPTGYRVDIGGMQQLVEESINDLYIALLLAVILVYLVMAAQFESFVHPLIIIFAVPLALIGAVIALFITNTKLGVTSLIGIIVLTGIVVNNAIVLVDYINLQRRRGYSTKEAILRASKVRLRPIIMTATTTILGLIPLAMGLGEGGEIQTPLAIAVIGGLVTSTLLTLFVIPVIYEFTAQYTGEHLGRSIVAATLEDEE